MGSCATRTVCDWLEDLRLARSAHAAQPGTGVVRNAATRTATVTGEPLATAGTNDRMNAALMLYCQL